MSLLGPFGGFCWYNLKFWFKSWFQPKYKNKIKIRKLGVWIHFFSLYVCSNFTYLVGLFLGFAGKFGFSPCFILRDNWYEPVSKAFLAFFWSFSWIITDNSLVLQLWCEPEKVASNLTIGLLVRFGLVNAMGISSKSTDSLTVKCENPSIYCYKRY